MSLRPSLAQCCLRPKPADFRRLRGYASMHRKIYFEKYRPLRHKVFAHRQLSEEAAVREPLAKTNIREMPNAGLSAVPL